METNTKDRYRLVFLEEYRIIQEKIDKIGEFKFKIRGWSITLQSALAISIITGKLLILWLPVTLLLVIPLIFFFMERQQERLSKKLSNRASILEDAIDRITFEKYESEKIKQRLDGFTFKKVIGSPKIADAIRRNIKTRKYPRKNSYKNILSSIYKKRSFLSENILYLCQLGIFVAILIISLNNILTLPNYNHSINNEVCYEIVEIPCINNSPIMTK